MSSLEGPAERFRPMAVWSRYLGIMWRVYDHQAPVGYVPTEPERFLSRENCVQACRRIAGWRAAV